VLLNTTVHTTLAASPVTATYGDTGVTLTALLKSGTNPLAGKAVAFQLNGIDVGSAVTDATGTATLTGVGLGSIGAGTYLHGVGATFGTGPAAVSATAQLVVNQASLTVKADDVSRRYGQTNPAFTATYTGFVNGDTAASLGGTLNFATAATAASNVGAYTLTASGQTATNYAITYKPGTVTVTPAPLTVTVSDSTKTYGQPNPAFTASYAGFANGETAASLNGSLSFATTATATSDAGTYTVTASGQTGANYAITYSPGMLTIAPVSASPTAPSALVVAYTGSNLAFADSLGHVSIQLRATLQDNSGGLGSITTANVVFRIVNAQTNALIATVSATAPASVDVPGSPVQLTGTSSTTGDSVATWSTDLGTASSQTFSVQVIVNGNYAGQTSGADLLTLARQDGSVSGGGYLRAGTNTAGQFAADPGSKINYSFNVRQTSTGAATGQVTVIFRRTTGGVLHFYEITSSQITSFGDNTSTGQTNFAATGNLMDVTNPQHPVVVAQNVALQIAATDGGNGGSTDMLGITIWSGQTLDFSSDWNGLNTLQDLLGGGNIQVK
jgi:hypothetical protein